MGMRHFDTVTALISLSMCVHIVDINDQHGKYIP